MFYSIKWTILWLGIHKELLKFKKFRYCLRCKPKHLASGKVSVYVVNLLPFFRDFLKIKSIQTILPTSLTDPVGKVFLIRGQITVLSLMEEFPADILPHTHTTYPLSISALSKTPCHQWNNNTSNPLLMRQPWFFQTNWFQKLFSSFRWWVIDF